MYQNTHGCSLFPKCISNNRKYLFNLHFEYHVHIRNVFLFHETKGVLSPFVFYQFK
jgi:hypothetical protein